MSIFWSSALLSQALGKPTIILPTLMRLMNAGWSKWLQRNIGTTVDLSERKRNQITQSLTVEPWWIGVRIYIPKWHGLERIFATAFSTMLSWKEIAESIFQRSILNASRMIQKPVEPVKRYWRVESLSSNRIHTVQVSKQNGIIKCDCLLWKCINYRVFGKGELEPLKKALANHPGFSGNFIGFGSNIGLRHQSQMVCHHIKHVLAELGHDTLEDFLLEF